MFCADASTPVTLAPSLANDCKRKDFIERTSIVGPLRHHESSKVLIIKNYCLYISQRSHFAGQLVFYALVQKVQ